MTLRWIRPEVSRGIALLTQHYGPQWHDMIDLSRLDMDYGFFVVGGTRCGCVGAQLAAKRDADGEATWTVTLNALRISIDDAGDYGLTTYEEDYPALTNEWRYAILCFRDPVRAGYRGPLERPQP
jgi:hypothetical protein